MEINGQKLRTFVVPSESVAGKTYEVTLWMVNWRGFFTGNLSCTCPNWLYKRLPVNERRCKHTDHVAAQLEQNKDLVEKTVKSEIFLKSGLGTNGRLAALISSVLSE